MAEGLRTRVRFPPSPPVFVPQRLALRNFARASHRTDEPVHAGVAAGEAP